MPRLIIPWPDPRLSTPAEPVREVTQDICDIWDEMIEVMEAMPGVGLAAPQIGIMQALAVVDASDQRGQAIRLANPVVISASDNLRSHEEASPNLPGVSAKLKRPDSVVVQYLDDSGQELERRFDGLWSTSVQHQIDHLNGKIFLDRLSRTKRDMLIRKWKKGRA